MDSCLKPEAGGSVVYGGGSVSIDASNASDGYIMVKYTGSAPKVKIQISHSGADTYTYTDKSKDYQTFPLSEGDGYYKVDVLENVSGDFYAFLTSTGLDVDIKNEFGAFLYPNQYVWYEEGDKAIDLARELSGKSSDNLDYVEKVYKKVIKSIKYDNDKAANVATDYIPDIDETLASGKGICFDYASLMSAMLRSQGVPTKLVVGYSGQAYHAWISVWLEEQGWVDNIIEFDGKSWSLMDPTLASNNSSKSVKKYIGEGSNYVVKYNY